MKKRICILNIADISEMSSGINYCVSQALREIG